MISAVPVVGDADPLSIDAMERGRALAAELCGDGHVLIQGHAVPDVGPIEAALAAMADVAASHELSAWKVYTHSPSGWFLDDHDPAAPAIGQRFLDACRTTGVPAIAVHKGLSGGSPYASPVDIGPAAAANPDLRFLVYHSGYETSYTEGPYDPDGAGVDRLLRSVTEAGIGAGGNVYAELGSTWRTGDGQPRRGRPRARQAARRVRAGAHPVGHRLDLVRLPAGPDRRLPHLRDHARVPGAVRLPGADPRREAPHPRPQRRSTCSASTSRRRPAGQPTSRGCGGAARPPTGRSARCPVATCWRRSCASTRGWPNEPPERRAGERYRFAHMFVKICGITNEDDALLAVAMGADAVGFVFAPSPRQIAAQQAYDITRRLPPEILTVGVFRDEHPKRVDRHRPPLGRQGGAAARHETPDDVAEVAKAGAVGDQGLPGRLAEARRGRLDWPTDLSSRRADARVRAGLRLGAGRRGARGHAADPRRRPRPGQRRRRGARPSSRGASTCRPGSRLARARRTR